MGIIRTQSIKNSINLYIGIIFGAINTILVFPFVFVENPQYWGLLQLLVSYSIIISSFSHIGTPHILIRYFPIFKDKAKLISFSFTLTLIGFLLFLIVFFSFKPLYIDYINDDPLLLEYFFLVVVLVFSTIFFDLLNSISRSHLDSSTPIFLNDVLIRLITFLLLLVYHFKLIDFKLFIYLYVASYCLKLIILFFIQIVKKRIPVLISWNWHEVRELLRYGLYVILGSGAAILVSRVDIIMIEYYLNLEYVAFYGLAFFIGSVIKVPARSVTSISSPLIASAFKENRLDKVLEIYKKTSINLLIISSLMFLLIWLNIDDILHILPEKFQYGKYVVLFIGLSQVVNLACGLNGLIIINSKYFKADLLFNVVLLTFVVITNILLIPKMGIDGAALASLLSIIIHNIIKLIYIYVKIKIQPFDFQSIKLFLISVLVYFIIQLTPMIDNSILSVILKTILVLSIFIPLVISMKISNDINDFYKNLILKIYKLFR